MTWNYREIGSSKKDRRPNGCEFEHRVIASQLLNRPLTKKEIVHHIDNNGRNNSPDNLMVFASNADHSRFHKGGVAVKTENGTYISIYTKMYNSTDKLRGVYHHTDLHDCEVCKTPTHNKRYCSHACAEFARRIVVNRPTKEHLEQLLESMPMTEISNIYNVSDKTIRKWCRYYEISLGNRLGYWAKLRSKNKSSTQ